MKTRTFLFLLSLLVLQFRVLAQSAPAGENAELATNSGIVKGTLLLPALSKRVPVVVIISGSGPTDRDGNNPAMKNNSLKMLAEGLQQEGIATLRYDKRGIAESKAAGSEEKDLRFDDYVTDAAAWVQKLKADKRFSKVLVLGHSEGSLIGMVASQRAKADGFISVAGAGQSADKIIRKQLALQPKMVTDLAYPILDSLAQGKTVTEVNPMLAPLFRPSVQPYLLSWFKFDPPAEIKKLTVPVLLIQGDQDLQVSQQDAQRLATAAPRSKLVVIPGMNHVLKDTGTDYTANIASYKNPDLALAATLVPEVSGFVKAVK